MKEREILISKIKEHLSVLKSLQLTKAFCETKDTDLDKTINLFEQAEELLSEGSYEEGYRQGWMDWEDALSDD